MRRIVALFVFVSFSTISFSQVKTPVKWNFSSRKIDLSTYEVHLTATLDKGWHTYSQTTPDGGPIATSIEFTKNPLIIVQGNSKEVGKLEQRHEDLFGVDVKQFSNKVDFIQLVKLKGKVKTSLNGTVEYMTCNDHECLPPTKEKFTVAL